MANDFDNNLPIYIQIMNAVKRDIVKGELKKGDKLPSIRDMSLIYKVNPNTIQRVYNELERENITFTQRGMGTFVTEDQENITRLKTEMANEFMERFILGMIDLGFSENDIPDILRQYQQENRGKGE